ncbi:MAG: hypothetical protein SVC26_06620 [Pseudomonadota bacterium]|nr:hypothetical protein [Pseudomonadota bacterium]
MNFDITKVQPLKPEQDSYFIQTASQILTFVCILAWCIRNGGIVVQLKKPTRTVQQNKALHVYCKQLSSALNEGGYDMVTYYHKTNGKLDLQWTPLSVKERLWRPTMKAMTGKDSTTKLSTAEVSIVYQSLDLGVSQHTQVSVPFPKKEAF